MLRDTYEYKETSQHEVAEGHWGHLDREIVRRADVIEVCGTRTSVAAMVDDIFSTSFFSLSLGASLV